MMKGKKGVLDRLEESPFEAIQFKIDGILAV